MDSLRSPNCIEVDVEKGIWKVDGRSWPSIGFGTYPLTGEVCTAAVKQAIEVGYRMIDTATFYDNFQAIAKALKGKDRSSFYLSSKVWHDKQSEENLRRDLEMTLSQLDTDYLDAYFLHWPNSRLSIRETLEAMEELRQRGKIRHIGLSNVTVNHLKRALEVGIDIHWVQIEMHPCFYDSGLLDFCRKHLIAVQAWRPLNLGRVSQDQLMENIGKPHGKTGCQVALRWIIQHGCIPLPGSKDVRHATENFEALNFKISDREMREIDKRALAGTRFRLTEERGLGFTDEFDFSYEECWPN